jgi:hypothetical protein
MPADKSLDDLPKVAVQKAPAKASTRNAKSAPKMGQKEIKLGDNGNMTSQVIKRVQGGSSHEIREGCKLINH